jgi:1,4-dihydroxy-2-naphthoate octaprenyltransferase
VFDSDNIIKNIGPKESRKRLAFGAAVFILTIFVLVIMIMTGISRWWRLFLFIPFMMAAIGFFQHKEKT